MTIKIIDQYLQYKYLRYRSSFTLTIREPDVAHKECNKIAFRLNQNTHLPSNMTKI